MTTANRFAPAAVLVAALGIIGFGAAGTVKGKAQAGSNVTVVNTSSQAIPVTLPDPKVYAAQYGTWNVGITNPTSNLDWARNTFQRYQQFYIPNGQSSQFYDVDLVYSGKEFVIDNVNATSYGHYGPANLVSVSALSSGTTTSTVSMAMNPLSGESVWSQGNMQTGMIARSNETVRVTASRTGTTGTTYVTVFVSGHLVDNP